MSRKITQKDAILRHLKDFGSITSFEAFSDYGITRLSDIIYRLRHEGKDIETKYLQTINRYGNVVHYGKYILNK